MRRLNWFAAALLPFITGSAALRAQDASGNASPTHLSNSGQLLPASPRDAIPSEMDCNGNGLPDDQDILGGFSTDFNGNGIPDECDAFLTAAVLEPGTEHRPPAAPGAYPPPGAGASATAPMSTYLATGEFFHSIVDLQIRGRGLDFVWARKYRSKAGPTTLMGNGWDYSYNIYLEPAGADMLLHDGNTRADLLTFDFIRNSWYREEFFRELRQNFDGTFTLQFSDTGVWNFHAFGPFPFAGKLSSIVDRNGNTIEILYDGLGRIQQIIDTLGRSIVIAYNADGLIESVTDFAGRQVVYGYYVPGDLDGSPGDLKSVRTPVVVGTPTGNDFPAGKTTTYTYATGMLHPELDHNLLTITDPKGQVFLRNVYDPTLNPADLNFDRLVKQIWGLPGQQEIDIVYVPQVPGPANNNAVMKAIVNDRAGNVEELYYDALSRGVMRREYTGRALANQPTTDFSNRPTGPLRVTDPAYFETRWQFNADSLATQIERPNQNAELFQYDSFNPDPRSRGNLLSHGRFPGPLGANPPLISESYSYDPLTNFVTQHIDGRGHATTHFYDPRGNKLQTLHRVPGVTESWEYNIFGQVTAHILPDNGSGHLRRDEFTYYAAGAQNGYLQSEIIDATGFALTTVYSYNPVGNVIQVRDPKNQTTQFFVNALGQVVRQASRPVSGTMITRDTYYDLNDNVVRIDIENRDENGTLQPNIHFTTTYEYDLLNNVTRYAQEVDAGHDAVTEYAYDANGNRTLVRYPEAVNGNQPSNTLTTLYDERDLVYREIRAEASPEQATTQIDYDPNGNATMRSAGLEGVPRFNTTEFDGYDRAIRSVDRMGNETFSEYDANGNMIHELVLGELNDVPGGGGNVRLSEVYYVYDEMDRRTREEVQYFDPQTQAPLGDGVITTETVYSPNSQIIAIIDAHGGTVQTIYDTANRTSVQTDPEGNSVAYGYDSNSNIVQIIQGERSQLGTPDQVILTTNSYDGLDRLISTQDALGNATTFGYDSRDNRVLRIDALLHETRYTYDGLDRLTVTVVDMDGDGASASDVDDIVNLTAYDDSSRQTGQTDDNGNQTAYVYDSLDRRTTIVHADGTSATTVFDVHGDAVQTQDANGSVVFSQYDALGRVILRSITPAPGVSADTTFETFAYDGLSHLVQAQDNDSIVTRAYDSAAHVLVELLNGAPTTASYDALGNQQFLAYPGGQTVISSFDALGRFRTVSDGFGPVVQNYYYGPGRLERRDYANNVRAAYSYDPVNRLVGVSHTWDPDGFSQLRAGHILGWDPTYNKVSRLDVVDGSLQTFTYDALSQLTSSTGGPAGARTYAHDGVHNRTNVVGAPPVGGPYTSDPNGPIPADFQMNQYTSTPAGPRTYDANGNLIAIGGEPPPGDCDGDGDLDLDDVSGPTGFVACQAGPGGGLAPGCECADLDEDGDSDLGDYQVLQQLLGPGSLPFEGVLIQYDYANRMVEYRDTINDVRHEYKYDALSRRIARIVDADGAAVETRYYYNGSQVIEERDGGGMTIATYVYADSYPDGVVSMIRSGLRYFFHPDDMYNVVAVTDAGGNVVEQYKYDDYGMPFFYGAGGLPLPESQIGNTRLFTGRDYDPETGFYYCRTRYLDPVSGRYTTRATVGIWGDAGNHGNGYAYVGNNPWSRLDPGGLCPALWWWRFTYWPAWWNHPWAWYPYVYGWYPYHWYWYPWGWWYSWYGWYPYWGWWWYPCHWWWWGWGSGWYQCPYWWWYSYHWWWYPYRWWWYPFGYWFNPYGWYWYPYYWWYGYGWWYPYGYWWYPYFWGWGWGPWYGWYYPYYSWWWYPYVWWYYPWGGWWYWGWGWYWWWPYTWWHWYGWWWYPWSWWGGCWWWDWWWPGWWCRWWWDGWWWGWWWWGWCWPGWWGGWWWWGWWWPNWWCNWWWGWWWWGWWHGWWWWGWWWWGWWYPRWWWCWWWWWWWP